jgi:hypothetical protein
MATRSTDAVLRQLWAIHVEERAMSSASTPDHQVGTRPAEALPMVRMATTTTNPAATSA